jgi:hypothetical protein
MEQHGFATVCKCDFYLDLGYVGAASKEYYQTMSKDSLEKRICFATSLLTAIAGIFAFAKYGLGIGVVLLGSISAVALLCAVAKPNAIQDLFTDLFQ